MAGSEQLRIGVDGGGSRCRVRITDASGDIIAEMARPGINAVRGVAALHKTILEIIDSAWDGAGLPSSAKTEALLGMGLAGVNHSSTRRAFTALAFPFAESRLTTDVHIACLGAHNGNDGAVVIIGTGSCGLLLKNGAQFPIGGWGFPVSDQSSGAWIGLEAVRRTLREHDGLIASSLLGTRILARFDGKPDTIIDWMLKAGPADYAEWAPLVFECREAQDPGAEAILKSAVKDLVQMLQRLQELGAPRLSLLGGLAAPLGDLLPEKMKAELSQPNGDALSGALLLAAGGKE